MVITQYSDIYNEDKTLRPYQEKAKKEIFDSWDEFDNVMFQMPTGTGKTRLFTSIIRDINNYSLKQKEPVKILIIAHRTELIDQIDESLNRYQVPHNVIAGSKKRDYRYPVSVASIQTITHPNNLKEAKKLKVQFIIIDEAHHALAATYKKLWDLFPESKKLGVTATPWRMNHQSFTDLFDTLVLSMPIKEFIKQGYLAPYKYYSLKSDSDIQSVIDDIELDKFGEYKESSLEEKMDIGSIRAQLLNSYLSLAEGKKGIIYAINIVHAKHICDEYQKAGYVAVSIDSKTPAAERKNLVNKFKKGDIDIIINVDIFSEGFDCPDIEFIQLARPTRSLVKYLQQVGRGLRPTKDKENCIILDNVGMYSRFGLPNARRHWKHHFLGKKIDEVQNRALSKGDGKPRIVDFSEGTEDMELIQDLDAAAETNSKEEFSYVDDFFPIFGVMLGKTTSEQAHELGYPDEVDEDTGEVFCNVDNIHFIYLGNILHEISWTRVDRDFPSLWKSKGFSWEISYDEWIDVFLRLGYRIEQRPEKLLNNGHITLRAFLDALSPDGHLEFNLFFYSWKNRFHTSLQNTLNTVWIHYYNSPIEKWGESDNEEDDDNEGNLIQSLERRNFVCDNFIFKIKQNKQIFEAYIQDDEYFIISQLLLDYSSNDIHRVRVGKIPCSSWMFWQMLREKIDNLKSIVHYGENYTVFHYKVMSKENVEKDKFFDYKGKEIDNPEIVRAKYEQELTKGEITDYLDIPVSKASFKAVLEDEKYVIYKAVKGKTKLIARMSINCDLSKEYPISVYQVRIGSEIYIPQNTKHNKDVHSQIVWTEDNSIIVRSIKKGKAYLFKYNIDGKLLKKGTIASEALEEVIPFKGEDIEKLKNAFDKKSTSYKYFWFMSLIQIYEETQVENISLRQILVKMVANAWKYVFMLNGQFSQSDQLPKYLVSIKSITNLDSNSLEQEVEDKLNEVFDTKNLQVILNPLLKNVPYRFLSPWIKFTDNENVMNISRKQESRCPYELYNDHVIIKKLWRENLIGLYESIHLFVEYSLETYLKIDPNIKETRDFYNTRYISLNQLLKGIKRRKSLEVVKLFLEKYKFNSTGVITPVEIMEIMPESSCNIDSDGRKRVNVPGNMWSLKVLDKLLSGDKLIDKYDNIQLFDECGLESYLKMIDANKIQDIYNTKYISLTKLLKAIKDNKDEKVVKMFLEKFKFSSTGSIRPAEIMEKIPESNCIIDSDGRKRVNVPGNMWSLKLLDKLLTGTN
ncbi:DEAD/DEAH box helicase [Xylanibacter ruminicola]|uniref:DEAD/DEAH box helicase n=1 Tax=Xylanibacter ruminicola TaxID=839 RepID=UPI00069196E4|nr:DEAD/DEAH box helicase [Xylanibacter ruminicola]